MYQNYHKHSCQSCRYQKDSTTTYQQYFNYYKELNQQQIYSTVEHGWQGVYFRIYDDLEVFNKVNNSNIKFVFGTEAYWVKDKSDKNSPIHHIILLAKNDKGRKAINRAIYQSFNVEDGYFNYRNRMDMNLLLSLPSDDVFVTTACVAFWEKESVDDCVIRLNEHFKSFYLEVQAHNTDNQKEVNTHILKLHEQYNIPLIAGTDSHAINEAQVKERADYLLSNGIKYDNTGIYYDLPTEEQFKDRFIKQGVLTNEQITEAIQNTNDTLKFDDIILDRSLKVPVEIQYKDKTLEERNKIFEHLIATKWNETKANEDYNKNKLHEYITEITNNVKEIEKCSMADYFLDTYDIVKLACEKYKGQVTPTGRGSAVSMYINKLLGFTKVDKINADVLMYAERFLTATRVLESHTPPDIDHNVTDRQPFIQAQKDIIGEQSTFDLIALGTLKYKSAFKMYARAYGVEPVIANEVTKQITAYEKEKKYNTDDDIDIDIYDYVDKKYKYLIDGCQKYMDISDNLRPHPCSTICYNGDVIDDIGVIMVKSEISDDYTYVAVIESGTVDHFGFLKQDYLIVDSIGLIYDIYTILNMKPLTINQLLEKIKGDKKVWDIYARSDDEMCINQFEKYKSAVKVSKYKPQNISELTQMVAALRPAFSSMYSVFESRQHFDYGIPELDDLIQDAFSHSSFILYQETLMKVLNYVGFTLNETYPIIKAISKKKTKVIMDAKEKFIKNFTDKIGSFVVPAKVWTIIENSASYGFNSAHAYCMALDSVTLAWMKAYYPLEFYGVALDRYTGKEDKNKVRKLRVEAMRNNIKVLPIAFTKDNRRYSINKDTNTINQSMSSIKYLQSNCAGILYQLGEKKYDNLLMLFHDIKNAKVQNKSIIILIKLGYFNQYGSITDVMLQYSSYLNTQKMITKFSTNKIISRAKISCFFNLDNLINMFEKISEKQLRYPTTEFAQYVKSNWKSIFDYYMERDKDIYSLSDKLIFRIAWEIQYIGCTQLIDTTLSDYFYVIESAEVNKYGTTFCTLYQVNNGEDIQCKIPKSRGKSSVLYEQGDIIYGIIIKKNKKQNDGKGNYVDSPELENVLTDYSLILDREKEMCYNDII